MASVHDPNSLSTYHQISKVTRAIARGDLSQRVDVEVEGEMSELKDTVNGMVEKLSQLAAGITRVSLDVGTMGLLGGQANVPGVEGAWLDLVNHVSVAIAFLR